MKWDFETWLRQNYGLRSQDLTKKEYAEEYPEPGKGEIKLKTFAFKRYRDSKG